MRKLIGINGRRSPLRLDAYPLGHGKGRDLRPGARSTRSDAAAQEPAGDAARVLLVEDEPGIVDFVRRGLEAEGFVRRGGVGRDRR